MSELRKALSDIPGGVQIQIVDDGSPVADWDALREALAAEAARAPSSTGDTCIMLPPLRLKKNTRKGGAILSAWRKAPSASWLAFLDADGAVPAREVRRIFDEIGANETAAIFASRVTGPDRPRKVRRHMSRRLQSAVFGLIARCLFGFSFGDSQCGFKIVRSADFWRVSPELIPHGFCFDLALWLALRRFGVPVKETSVRWQEQSGGHLSMLRHGPGMLRELLALRLEYRASRSRNKDPRSHFLSISA